MQKIEFIWLILKNDFFDDNIIVQGDIKFEYNGKKVNFRVRQI